MRKTRLFGRVVLVGIRTNPFGVSGDSRQFNGSRQLDSSSKFPTYQLLTVGYWPTVALTGNGELGFDSGEGA